MIAITTKDFIIRAKKVHGRLYGYSMVKYITAKTKVKIFCSRHGYFLQLPYNHLEGAKCYRCEKERRRSNTVEFIKRAKKIHGNKYDYSVVKYINSYIKVLIICPKHGKFLQQPHGHLNGYGCPKCGHKSHASNTVEFIKRAKKIHGNKYDYSKTKYVLADAKVLIICPKHGKFLQQSAVHLRGSGCPRCGSLKTTSSASYFIKRAKKIHGNKYDYSAVKYINNYIKVLIICPRHGKFLQRPTHHLTGCACPKCQKVILKDGTCWASRIEAWYYLTNLKNPRVVFKYNKRYGLGGRRYDFYLPDKNKYIEVTSFDSRYKRWKKYFRIIKEKKRYVENILMANFEFISKTLTLAENQYVNKNMKL